MVTGPPGARAATRPFAPTDAMAGLLLLQVNVLISRFPDASRASAPAWAVSPTRMTALSVTVTVATGFPPPPPVMLNPPQPAAARDATARKRSAGIMWAGCGGPGDEVALDVLAPRRARQR